jgi:hypothetical protein
MEKQPYMDYTPRSDAAPEQLRDARARAWAFVFDCYRRRNGKGGGPLTAPDDAMKGSEHDRARDSIPEPS